MKPNEFMARYRYDLEMLVKVIFNNRTGFKVYYNTLKEERT